MGGNGSGMSKRTGGVNRAEEKKELTPEEKEKQKIIDEIKANNEKIQKLSDEIEDEQRRINPNTNAFDTYAMGNVSPELGQDLPTILQKTNPFYGEVNELQDFTNNEPQAMVAFAYLKLGYGDVSAAPTPYGQPNPLLQPAPTRGGKSNQLIWHKMLGITPGVGADSKKLYSPSAVERNLRSAPVGAYFAIEGTDGAGKRRMFYGIREEGGIRFLDPSKHGKLRTPAGAGEGTGNKGNKGSGTQKGKGGTVKIDTVYDARGTLNSLKGTRKDPIIMSRVDNHKLTVDPRKAMRLTNTQGAVNRYNNLRSKQAQARQLMEKNNDLAARYRALNRSNGRTVAGAASGMNK